MPIMVNRGEGDFSPAPEGLHQAVCVDVVERGIVDTQWGPKRKVDVIWQVVPVQENGEEVRDEKGKRFQCMQRYTASLHEKADLHKHLKAWRGKPFTKDELDNFDLENVVGANCQIQIVHNVGSNGRTYGNVQAIVPLGKNMTKLRPVDYTRMKERQQQPAGVGGQATGTDDDLPF